MEWAKAFGPDMHPSEQDISAFIANPMWEELNDWLTAQYGVEPAYSYSSCSAQPGWNVKYQKAGRSLCTLYPMDGFFIALVVIGNRERTGAELLMPACSAYTQRLFSTSSAVMGGQWLMMQIENESVLEDVKRLIQLRRAVNKKQA